MRRRLPKNLNKFSSVLVLISGLLLIIASSLSDNPKDSDIFGVSDEQAVVSRVIDGDTVELDSGQKVRYIGVNTPETGGPAGLECFGKEATAFNKTLVEGKIVRLVKDVSETDRYGRLLRYVYVGDQFINEILVEEGYAQASSYPPDIQYQYLFEEAERQAREGNKGLWGKCQ